MEDSPSRPVGKGHEYWLEAQCLLHGHGIEPNKEYAITWFDRSAELGETKALYALGCIYEEGNGVKRDLNKAIDYFLKASKLGEPQSMQKLAKYH